MRAKDLLPTRIFAKNRHLTITCGLVFTAYVFLYYALTEDRRSLFHRPVREFGRPEYEEAMREYPFPEAQCKTITELKPNYKVCGYTYYQDFVISGSILQGRAYEPQMSLRFRDGHREWPESVFVDCGINIGVHSLYMAENGCRVYGVDPITPNLLRVAHAAKLSHHSDRVRLFRNGVDSERRRAEIEIRGGNIGASELSGVDSDTASEWAVGSEGVNIVLLYDIFEEVLRSARRDGVTTDPLVVLLKMDIEMYECRAILGSRGLFTDQRFDIPMFSTEWNYVLAPGRYHELCPFEMMRELVHFLTGLGYVPHEYVSGTAMNTSVFHTWPHGTHIVWRKWNVI